MNTSEYNALIGNAYIEPIRSVVMIDDKFPTYAQLLKKCNSPAQQTNFSSSEENYLDTLCNLCEQRHWTFHIENGLPDLDGAIPYNADLIFLDFKLGVEDDGEIAIKAIKKYSNSPRFNFFVVYTEENIQKVFSKIVSSLGWRECSIDPTVEDTIADIESEHPNFSTQLTEIARASYYLYIIAPEVGKSAVLDQIMAKLNSDGITCEKPESLCNWGLGTIANSHPNKSLPKIKITGNFDEKCNWLQIGNLFLTIIKKDINFSGNDLLSLIENAAYAWKPTPGQLIMKDAKNQIDDFCFFDLFPSKKQEIAWFYFTYIDKHNFMNESDILYNLIDLVIKDQLKNRFHSDLSSLAVDKNINDFYPQYHPSENVEKDLFHDINIYNSTLNKKNPTHFSTGMIFKDIGLNSPSYWICMTQDCDLIPSQKSLKWSPGDEYKPITFVKLHQCSSQKKFLSRATHGNYVFFAENETPMVLCFIEESCENPHYETFFAPQKGKIDTPVSITIYQVDVNSSKKLIFTEHKFSFIAQLRQEYATMLLQRISNHRARTPVNYINLQ